MPERKPQFELKLGRFYLLKLILDTFVLAYLEHCARTHVMRRRTPMAVFSFDLIGSTISVRGMYESEQLETIVGWLHQAGLLGGVALDIGANIGNHSLYFARFYERVYGFEPNPKTFQLYKLNTQQSTNITACHFGLSDSNGEARLKTCADNAGAAHVASPSAEERESERIELKTLDSIAGELERPVGLIKLDVEGHELAVLKGARRTIQEQMPVILFEQCASDFQGGSSPVVEYLKALGYKSFATVMPSPYLPLWIPRVLRPLLNSVVRLFTGYRFVLRTQERFAPDYYSMVVAIPSQR